MVVLWAMQALWSENVSVCFHLFWKSACLLE